MNRVPIVVKVVREAGKAPYIPFQELGQVRLRMNDATKTEVIVGNPYFTYKNGTVKFSGVQISDAGLTTRVEYELDPDMVTKY